MMEKAKPFTEKLLLLVLAVTIIAFFVLASFRSALYDEKWYYREYEKLGVYAQVNESTAGDATDSLLGYLRGKNELSSFYNEKEQGHMRDVKALIGSVNAYYYISLVGIVVLFLLLYFSNRKAFLRNMTRLFILIGAVMLLSFLVLYLLQSMFSSAFTGFHLLFFDNDLWLLDPATDNMILLFPEQFFLDITARIVLHSLLSGLALGVIGALVWRYWRNT